MPELIPNGPDIPTRLFNELDSGRVVFFCGAGISSTPGSDLPSFKELVSDVYKANHIRPDDLEREALDCAEPNPARRRPALDKALGLLERKERLGAIKLRKTIIQKLSAPAEGTLNVHRALIDLSKTDKGVRLITTNFDKRFVEAGLDMESVDAAPKLPVPKPHTWSSLVHLHGRIGENENGLDLILTAADFGRAYLTERWAARFITELSREFTVVFIGYSLGDPVMSYMIDALAADRVLGARFAKAYAFADHDGTPDDRLKTQFSWQAKNVEPILYDKKDHHSLLADTLIEWARVCKEPLHARSEIAIGGFTKTPAGPNDPVVERVVWALQDPVAAKILAEAPPITNEDEFSKFEKWLEIFTEKGLFRYTDYNSEQESSEPSSKELQLVDHGFPPQILSDPGAPRRYLSIWLARHLHVPQLLSWALRNGGHFHPYLRQEIQSKLARGNSNIPARLRILWTVLLNDKPQNRWEYLWIYHQYLEAASDSERRRIEDRVMESLAPRLVVSQGPPPILEFRHYFKNNFPPIKPVDSCAHLRLVICDEDTWHQLSEILKDPEFLASHAESLTGYLEQACLLSEEDNEIENSPGYWSSIEVHGQIRDKGSWTHLIDLARDSYFALAAKNKTQARKLLLRWAESRHLIFRKLALYALAKNSESDIKLSRKLLLEGRNPGLWDPVMEWEVIYFFESAGSRMPRNLRTEIIRSIHAGPKYKKRRTVPNYEEIIQHEKGILLYNLSASGVLLDKKSMELAKSVQHRVMLGDLGENDYDEGGSISYEELAPKSLVQGTVTEILEVMENTKIRPDGLRGLAIQKPIKVIAALRRHADQGKWNSDYWRIFLLYLTGTRDNKKPSVRLHYHVANILSKAPDRIFKETGSAMGGFINILSKEYDKDREEEYGILWDKAWNSKGEGERVVPKIQDPLTAALNHPAGKLAEAALTRLGKYEQKSGEKLPELVRSYFNAICNDTDGRLGRVMLATRLHYLFAIDPEWTTEHLLSRLSRGQSSEAADLWSAYGWSFRIGPNLLRAFKFSFLDILQNEDLVVQNFDNLIELFMAVCMDAPGELSDEDIRSVVDTFSENSLTRLLYSMKKYLKEEDSVREVIWRDKLYPWLNTYWPQIASRNTRKTSIAILDLIADSGGAFPDAVEWSFDFLRPLKENFLHTFTMNDHPERFPDEMLDLLGKVVDKTNLPSHEYYSLRIILDALIKQNPEMAKDIRFQNLYKLAVK